MNKTSQSNRLRAAFFILLTTFAVLAVTCAPAQTPLLQLKAVNYNPTTGLWTATVGANAQAGGTYPTFATGVSPNGAPAVVFNGANYLSLASSIAAANGYTAFAYIKPATGAGPYALFGGSSGAFEYRIYNSKQDALKQQTTDLGSETTALSTSTFSVIDVTVTNVNGGGFRVNGVSDGSTVASGFTAAINAIGARASATGNENYSGSVCEIDIYSGVLTAAQISSVELAISNSYVNLTAPAVQVNTTANPSVATVGGNDTFSASFSGTLPISYQWSVATNASGGGAAIITAATNTTLVLTNLQLTSTNMFYSLQATNAIAPYVATSSWLNPTVQPLSTLLQVQLIATNYDTGSGVWADTSGNNNNATYSGSAAPTLVPLLTPNGGSALNLTGLGSLVLASTISPGSGYTVFAYIEPTNPAASNRNALTGGSASGALEYDVYQHKQDYLNEYTADEGEGNATIPTNSFSLIDLAVSSSTAAFRFNGMSDGTPATTSFGAPLARIGNNHGGGDGFEGNIAEIDIYNSVLTSIQISNVEAQLVAEYVTANSIVVFPATVSPTNNVYAGTAVTLAAPVAGGTGTTTYQWQTDNGSGGIIFANISGATTTNYVLNTTSISPNAYEYQLVATPFGGSSVTSAPVTLTVNAASAPVVASDTTFNPVTPTVGGNGTVTASFTGTLPIGGYQWYVATDGSGDGSVPITGATNTTLVFNNLQLTNSGYYYSLRATNSVSPYVGNSTWTQLTVQPLTPLVQLMATNYSGGTWVDSSGNGNNATYFGATTPTLLPFVTPNGGSAVKISSGGGSFVLSSSLDPSSGYTVFAYVEPSSTTGRNALTGGSSPTALEYDIFNGKQDYLSEYTYDYGIGTATIPTSSFSLIDLAVNSSGASFRFNGMTDTNESGATFGQPITQIGNNEGGGDSYVGDIAEIDIYNGVLSSLQISNIEAQLTAEYVTASNIAIGPATVSPTNNVYAGTAVTLKAAVIGGTGTASYQWQTDNGSGGITFASIDGATTTNYVLNTTSISPNTYEYQLVGTPFGGISVTSTPVILTLNAASAPVVLSDTIFSPSTATVGGNDSVTASFTGTLPIGGYQWYIAMDGSGDGSMPITGATNATFVLTNLQLANSGYYYSLRATNTVSPYVGNSTWTELTVQPLSSLLQVQLIATNYNGSSGVWTDTSGNNNNATYAGATMPTLVSSVTPSGASAVNIGSGGGSFLLSASLDPSSGYTVFAYVEPSNTTGRHALTGGSAGTALEYDIYNGNQDYLTEYTFDYGHGIATIPTSSFSLVDLAVNSSGANFRFNGTTDTNESGATFGQPITRIANNEGSGDSYVGNIAEIDIYNGVLSSIQISNVEAQLTAEYVTVGINTNPTNITATVVAGSLQLSWPPDHTGWTLQMQTNSLSTGLGTNWVSMPNSTTTNMVTVPIVTGNGCVFYRLEY